MILKNYNMKQLKELSGSMRVVLAIQLVLGICTCVFVYPMYVDLSPKIQGMWLLSTVWQVMGYGAGRWVSGTRLDNAIPSLLFVNPASILLLIVLKLLKRLFMFANNRIFAGIQYLNKEI